MTLTLLDLGGIIFFIFEFRLSYLWNKGSELDAAYGPLAALILHDFKDFIMNNFDVFLQVNEKYIFQDWYFCWNLEFCT